MARCAAGPRLPGPRRHPEAGPSLALTGVRPRGTGGETEAWSEPASCKHRGGGTGARVQQYHQPRGILLMHVVWLY